MVEEPCKRLSLEKRRTLHLKAPSVGREKARPQRLHAPLSRVPAHQEAAPAERPLAGPAVHTLLSSQSSFRTSCPLQTPQPLAGGESTVGSRPASALGQGCGPSSQKGQRSIYPPPHLPHDPAGRDLGAHLPLGEATLLAPVKWRHPRPRPPAPSPPPSRERPSPTGPGSCDGRTFCFENERTLISCSYRERCATC